MEKLAVIDQLITAGRYEEALYSLRPLEKEAPDNKSVRFNLIGFLIDIGDDTRNPTLIHEALEKGRKLEGTLSNEFELSLQRHLAKGYSALYSINLDRKRRVKQLFEDSNLREAKKRLRKAIELSGDLGSIEKAKLLTDYGNCLDHLGRTVEALQAYEDALSIEPTFPMALGNKALALQNFADISGHYRPQMYIKAYQLLGQALNDARLLETGGKKARVAFKEGFERIENLVANKELLNQDLTHLPFPTDQMSDFEKFYVEFSSLRKLFMNFHLHEDGCEATIVDSIMPRLSGPEDAVNELSEIVNQIKEDFATSRMLLAQSQYQRNDFSRIGKKTYYTKVGNCRFDIYSGLMKASFKEAYDILDKIAVFINKYYNLGLIDKSVDFLATGRTRCIWRNADGNIRENVKNSNNICLYALYDIYLDMRSDYGSRFSEIRNALVHRKLTIVAPNALPTRSNDTERIAYDDLFHLTVELLRSVKSAIIYVINLITLEEWKKGSSKGTLH